MPYVRVKRSINLEEIIKQYLEDIDPIQRLIDWQLHTSWYIVLEVLKGKTGKSLFSKDSIEDEIINALDNKYFWADCEEGVMFQLRVGGYSEKEVSRIFMCSTRWVRYQVKAFSMRWERKFG